MTVGTTQLAPGNGHNYIINGAFDIWQRGTSFSGNVYNADRWRTGNNPSAISRSTDVPNGFTYSIDMTGSNHLLNHRIESSNGISLADKSFTVSFYAKSLSGTNALTVAVGTPDSLDNFAIQNIEQTSSAISISTSWARYTVNFSSLSSSISNGAFIYIFRNGATATDRTLITGVQLEAGSVATPFKRNAPSLQGELAACQRYYIQTPSSYPMPGGAIAYKINGVACSVQFPSQMRATPSLTITGFRDATNGTTSTVSSLNAEFTNDGIAQFLGAFSAGSLTVGRAYSFGYTADAEL